MIHADEETEDDCYEFVNNQIETKTIEDVTNDLVVNMSTKEVKSTILKAKQWSLLSGFEKLYRHEVKLKSAFWYLCLRFY